MQFSGVWSFYPIRRCCIFATVGHTDSNTFSNNEKICIYCIGILYKENEHNLKRPILIKRMRIIKPKIPGLGIVTPRLQSRKSILTKTFLKYNFSGS